MGEWSGNLATTSVTQLLTSKDFEHFSVFSHCHSCGCPFLSEKDFLNERYWEDQGWAVRHEG